ncbi:substrate-binding domain-containing protein, partial [Acinetobacter baumannii]
IPTVLLDRAPKELDIDLVSTDNALGGSLAARHLLDLQRRHVACIAGPDGLELSDERVQGFRQALQAGGLALAEGDLLHADFSGIGGY